MSEAYTSAIHWSVGLHRQQPHVHPSPAANAKLHDGNFNRCAPRYLPPLKSSADYSKSCTRSQLHRNHFENEIHLSAPPKKFSTGERENEPQNFFNALLLFPSFVCSFPVSTVRFSVMLMWRVCERSERGVSSVDVCLTNRSSTFRL